MSETPHILVTPRSEPCIARTVFDDEAALLRTEFEYPKQADPSPPMTAERLNQDLGIEIPAPRAILGDIEMVFVDDQRLESIEWRTNLSSWPRAQIDDLPGTLPSVWIGFDVAYDSNQIYSHNLDVSVQWDPVRARVVLRFDEKAVTTHWVRLADTVAVGISSEGALVELRVDDLAVMPSVDS